VQQFSFLSLPSLASSHFPIHLRDAHARCPVLLDTMASGGQPTARRGQPVMVQPTRGLTKDQEVLLDSWLPLLRAREMAVRQAARQLGCSEGLVARARDGVRGGPRRERPPVLTTAKEDAIEASAVPLPRGWAPKADGGGGGGGLARG